MQTALFSALPAVAIAHVVEEFALPGGFAAWYALYRPETAASFTRGFAVGINALLIAACCVPLALGPTERGVAFWLTVAALLAGNAVFHLRGALRTRRYSPGMATGLVLAVPLAVIGFVYFLLSGAASAGTALSAAVLGGGYALFTAWNHRRRAARQPGA